MVDILRRLWRTVRMIGWIVAGIGIFALFVEGIRAYQTLYAAAPWLAWVYVATLLLIAVGLTVHVVWRQAMCPAVLCPPRLPDVAERTPAMHRRYARYLLRYASRLAVNPAIEPDEAAALQANAAKLTAGLRRRPRVSCAEAREALEQAVCLALNSLDAHAERAVRNCVRDVMLAVAVSPWRSVDLAVVTWRNLRMIIQITQVYNARPRVGEQLLVLRDVLTVLAMVNFLNLGSRLFQNLASSLPFLGRFADDIAQGIGAGLMTSVAGHAAAERCRAFGGWNAAVARDALGNRLRDFAADIKGMVLSDLLPDLRRPIEASMAPEDRVELGARLRQGVGRAIDETTSVMDSFLLNPVRVAGRGAVGAGTAIGGAAWRGARGVVYATGRISAQAVRRGGSLAASGGRAVAQGVVAGAGAIRRALGSRPR